MQFRYMHNCWQKKQSALNTKMGARECMRYNAEDRLQCRQLLLALQESCASYEALEANKTLKLMEAKCKVVKD